MLADPNVQEILIDVTKDDENSIPIIQCLLNGKTTDEEIAEETEIRLNIVRRILYKLYDAGVASYKRSKDPETQWYTYSWKFEEDKIAEIISDKVEKFSQELHQSLEYEEDNMFFLSVPMVVAIILKRHRKEISYARTATPTWSSRIIHQ